MADQTSTKSSMSNLLNEAPTNRNQNAQGASGGEGKESVISGDAVFEGKITAQKELRVDGTFKGEIVSQNRVVVGPSGKLEDSKVEAKSMVVSGRVVGNLKVLERLELLSTGEIYGDLETQPGALIIEKGARLEGRCSMGLNEDEAPAKGGEASAPTGVPTKPAEKKS